MIKIPTKLKMLIAVLIIIALAAISLSIYMIAENSRIKSQEPKVPNAAGVLLTGSDRDKALSLVSNGYTNIINSNGILNIQDSLGYTSTMIYNNDDEAVLEDPSTGARTIFLNNNHTVYIGDTIAYGQDSNVLMLLDQALKMANDNKDIDVLRAVNDLTLSDVDEDGNLLYTKYCIDLSGWDELTELYSCVSVDFADAMIANLKEQMQTEEETAEETAEETTEETTETLEDSSNTQEYTDIPDIGFRMYYVMSGETLAYGGCYTYFANKPSDELTWNDIQLSWEIGEIIEVDNWSLEDGWYSADWDNLKDWEDTSVVEELFTNLYNELTQMLDKKTEEMQSSSEHDNTEAIMNESAMSGNNETVENENSNADSESTGTESDESDNLADVQ